MTVTTIEYDLVKGIITILLAIAGFFLIQFFNKQRTTKTQGPLPQPAGVPQNGYWAILTAKIDGLVGDMGEVKTLLAVQSEKIHHINERMTEGQKRMDTHSREIADIKKEHNKNHGGGL